MEGYEFVGLLDVSERIFKVAAGTQEKVRDEGVFAFLVELDVVEEFLPQND